MLGVSSLRLPCEIAKANFWRFRMGFPRILVDTQSIFCDFQSVSVSFNQLQSTLFSFNQLDSGIPKVGKTHTGALLETEILKAGIPKSGIPKTGIPNLGIPKLGIPKTGRVTAPVVQTPLALPLIFPLPTEQSRTGHLLRRLPFPRSQTEKKSQVYLLLPSFWYLPRQTKPNDVGLPRKQKIGVKKFWVRESEIGEEC